MSQSGWESQQIPSSVELQKALQCCALPFYTAPLSPNQICRRTYNTHAHRCLKALQSAGHFPQTRPITSFKKKTPSVNCWMLFASESRSNEGRYKNTAGPRVLKAAAAYIHSLMCPQTGWDTSGLFKTTDHNYKQYNQFSVGFCSMFIVPVASHVM